MSLINQEEREKLINKLRILYVKNLETSSKIMRLTARLIKENPNIGITLDTFEGGGSGFPPRRYEERYGQLLVDVFLVYNEYTDIYWPGSTRYIAIANIEASFDMLMVKMNSFKYPFGKMSRGAKFERVDRYEGLNPLPKISRGEIKKLFQQAQEDVRRIFFKSAGAVLS